MVGTIAPVVYGRSTNIQRVSGRHLALFHLLGLVAGGMVIGFLFAEFGVLLRVAIRDTEGIYLVILPLMMLYALHELGVVSLPYPEWKRQVQSTWRYSMHPLVTQFLFGTQLGIGYLTFVSVATLHIVTIGVVLLASPLTGTIIMGLFAIARGGATILFISQAKSPKEVAEVNDLITRTSSIVHLLNGWILAMAFGYLAVHWTLAKGIQ